MLCPSQCKSKKMIGNLFRALLAVLLLPPLLIVSAIAQIWRTCVSKVLMWRNSRVLGPLNILGCFYSKDKMYEDPQLNMVPIVYLKGNPDPEKMKERLRNVFTPEIYPELFTELKWCLGVPYLEKLENPGPVNVQVVTEPLTKEEFDKLQSTLMRKPWVKGEPYVEFVYVKSYRNSVVDSDSAILSKLHHTILDGFCIMNMTTKICDPDPKVEEEIKNFMKKMDKVYKSPTGLEKIRMMILAPLLFLYEFLGYLGGLKSLKMGKEKGSKVNAVVTAQLPLQEVNDYSQSTGKKVSTLLLEAFTTATRNHCLKHGIKPEDMPVFSTRPRLGRPEGLTNHFIADIKVLPVSAKTKEERLTKILKEQKLNSCKVRALGSIVGANLTGPLFGFIPYRVAEQSSPNFTITSFVVGWQEKRALMGYKVQHLGCAVGVGTSMNEMTAVILSSFGYMSISLTMDLGVFGGGLEGAETFLKDVVENFVPSGVGSDKTVDNDEKFHDSQQE